MFFSYPLNLPQGKVVCSSWFSEIGNSKLAIALDNGNVYIFNEEGENVHVIDSQRESTPVVLAWHPSSPILAIAWKDGGVSLWNEKDNVVKNNTIAHQKKTVTLIVWSAKGTRMVSADINGALCVWRTNEKGHLSVLRQLHIPGSITHVCFLNSTKAAEDALMQRHREVEQEEEEFISQIESKLFGGKREAAHLFAIESETIPPVIFGGSEGSLYMSDLRGAQTQLCKLEGAITKLLYQPGRNELVTLVSTNTLYTHEVFLSGRLMQHSKVRLSVGGSGEISNLILVSESRLAYVNGENQIRIWHLRKDLFYTVKLSNSIHNTDPGSDRIDTLAYLPSLSLLVGGTQMGHVAMWRFHAAEQEGEQSWVPQPSPCINSPITHIAAAQPPTVSLLVSSQAGIFMVKQTEMAQSFCEGVVAFQSAPQELILKKHQQRGTHINTHMKFNRVYLSPGHFVVYSRTRVEIHTVNKEQLTQTGYVGSFDVPDGIRDLVVFEDSVFIAEGPAVSVYNFQGVVKHTLSFADTLGDPNLLALNNHYLCCVTTNNAVMLWDVLHREPRALVKPRQLKDSVRRGPSSHVLGTVSHVAVNADGSRVGFLATASLHDSDGSDEGPSRYLYIYHVEPGIVESYDFGRQNRLVVALGFDAHEPKLLAAMCAPSPGQLPLSEPLSKLVTSPDQATATAGSSEAEPVEERFWVTTLFSTPEVGIVEHNSVRLEKGQSLLALDAPLLYCTAVAGGAMSLQTNGSQVNLNSSAVDLLSAEPELTAQPLRDMVVLASADEHTRNALIQFSYLLTLGHLDEAYRTVRLITTPAVWPNMARMAIKTRRVDFAEVCLGNMGDALGTKMLREQAGEADAVRLATVAIYLGMYEEAEELYRSVERWDLVIEMLHGQGQFIRAIEIATAHSRIHLKNTYYAYATFLETEGNLTEAVKYYELAETHRQEVPRMLFNNSQLSNLEGYIRQSQDPLLKKWLGQYCESVGDMKSALQYYADGEEWTGAVRVLCLSRDVKGAERVVEKSGNEAAAFHLAQFYEREGAIRQAIDAFKMAGRLSHAVRLARENEMTNDILSLALQADPQTISSAAKYFENMGMLDKAIMLYHKAGDMSKAALLCFASNQTQQLLTMVNSFGKDTDPLLLERVSDYLIGKHEYERAVTLFINGGQFDRALDLCVQHEVFITDAMAEQMAYTPEDAGEEERKQLLLKVARCCKHQGSYHLSAKKYTQAGERVKALKVLLKSGDTEKIIFFASMSRSKEIYVLAANFLQKLDWRNDAEIMRQIHHFYTKARAFDSLAGFYDACAQVEIDEYQNYEKAQAALREACKFMAKARIPNRDAKLVELRQKLNFVELFVRARQLAATDTAEMLKICKELLHDPDVETGIRMGDVYGVMIEHYRNGKNATQAMRLLQQMQEKEIPVSYFIDPSAIQWIYSSHGQPVPAEFLEPDEGAEPEAEVYEEEDVGEDL